MRILILDDEPNIGAALRRQFRHDHLEAELVDSAERAEFLLRTQHFDAVLVDHDLGYGPSGLEFLRYVRTEFPGIRRLLMSAGDVDGWQGVADEVLSKPFDTARVSQVLEPVAPN